MNKKNEEPTKFRLLFAGIAALCCGNPQSSAFLLSEAIKPLKKEKE